MSVLLVSSVLFGLLIIAIRGPLIFAPVETLQFYKQRVFGSHSSRIMLGALMGAIGISMFLSAQDVEGAFPGFVSFIGMVLVGAMIVLIIAPGPFVRFVFSVMDMVGTRVLRGHGIISVVGAAVWIYLCFVLL